MIIGRGEVWIITGLQIYAEDFKQLSCFGGLSMSVTLSVQKTLRATKECVFCISQMAAEGEFWVIVPLGRYIQHSHS